MGSSSDGYGQEGRSSFLSIDWGGTSPRLLTGSTPSRHSMRRASATLPLRLNSRSRTELGYRSVSSKFPPLQSGSRGGLRGERWSPGGVHLALSGSGDTEGFTRWIGTVAPGGANLSSSGDSFAASSRLRSGIGNSVAYPSGTAAYPKASPSPNFTRNAGFPYSRKSKSSCRTSEVPANTLASALGAAVCLVGVQVQSYPRPSARQPSEFAADQADHAVDGD